MFQNIYLHVVLWFAGVEEVFNAVREFTLDFLIALFALLVFLMCVLCFRMIVKQQRRFEFPN